VKITILSHNLTSNAAMRAHRLAVAARHFADVTMIGPMKHRGAWGALPQEPWIKRVESKNLPKFFNVLLEMIVEADADVLIAVKPYLASYGLALLAGECHKIPVILDIDDLDVALAPKRALTLEQALADLRDPASVLYLGVLARAPQAAAAITVASTNLQRRFGGTLVPHGCLTELFDPVNVDRSAARRRFGFAGPVVLFPGTRRTHKGLKPLAKAVARIDGAKLAVLCRPDDFTQPEWAGFPLIRIPLILYSLLPELLAAADVVAVPQLDTEGARHQMPMKVYDAMAMAKPIVASTVSDLPEALDGCAKLVSPGDVEELARAISHLLQNPAEGRLLGERARKRCLDKYSMQSVAQSLSMAVELALKAGPHRQPVLTAERS
jgi:glycosyltransferase involved in cell wall biosynthesis